MHPVITQQQLDRALALRDLSEPASGPHAMQLVAAAVGDALEHVWGAPVLVHRSRPVVTIADNYETLGYPAGAPAREARYTRYVDDRRLLRTHMTAMVPGALRRLARPGDAEDVVVACPGLVYRRDVVDRLHVGEPHQLDLWRVRHGKPLTDGDLDEMVELVVSAVVPGSRHRTLDASHPYTTAGREVEVDVDGEWVELLECGLAADHVLRAGGLDPERWSGLALGLGLDRALMLRKGVTDIRLLRSDDPRVARQMLDLEPYREVSTMPPTRRDLSIAVAADLTAEELGDRIRERVAPAALEAVEEVAVVAETPAALLPPQAIARIGLRPGQKNVLVRLVLRHPTRTLTAWEANETRDGVYAAIHEGSVYEWAGGRKAAPWPARKSDSERGSRPSSADSVGDTSRSVGE
jgi:phenylalanyl-tRNA synthetase alpha chain